MIQIKYADPDIIKAHWLGARVAQNNDYNPDDAMAELSVWESGPLVNALKGMVEPFPTGRVSDKELALMFRHWYMAHCPRVLHELRPGHKLGNILEALDKELVFVEGDFLGKMIEALEAGAGGLGWMIHLRKTSQAPRLPLANKFITCVMINVTDQWVKQATKPDSKRALLETGLACRVRGEVVIGLVFWPGQKVRSDAFLVDDYEALIDSLGGGEAGHIFEDVSGVTL